MIANSSNMKDTAVWQKIWIGDAVKNSGSGFTTLVAGSISVGKSAGAGIGETDNLAYLLKATANYNTNTDKYFMDVAMITADGLVATRTVDDVTNDSGALLIDGTAPVGKEIAALPAGSIVAFEMTASEDEADSNEWILSIGQKDANTYTYVNDKITDWTKAASYKANLGDYSCFAVQIGIADDEFIGFYPKSNKQDGSDNDTWADNLVILEKDKYNFGVIAIDDNNFVEGGDIDTISENDVIAEGAHNAIIVTDDDGDVIRVFTFYNNL